MGSAVTTLMLIAGVSLVIGVPIACSLGLAGSVTLALESIDLIILPQRIFAAINSFPLLAVVFFVLAGELMLKGGISQKLVNLATCVFGRIPGALAVIDIVTCAFFGALSGSSLATTAAIGSVMHPEMVKNGYEKSFSATIQAAGGILGVLIPPSIPLVIYAVTSGNTSAGDLFLAVVPSGLLMALVFIILSLLMIWLEKMPINRVTEKQNIGKAFMEGIWALLMPVIILGGIYSGIFTATESAIVASFYALIVGTFVYRALNLKTFVDALITTVKVSANVMFLVAAASVFAWVMTYLNIPQTLTEALLAVVKTRTVFLLATAAILLVAGMLLDTSVAILLLVPLLSPMATSFGIDPIHMGILTVVNLALGNITPPFGATLFVSSSITDVKVATLYKRVLPFCLVGVVAVLITTFVPAISVGFLSMIR